MGGCGIFKGGRTEALWWLEVDEKRKKKKKVRKKIK